MRIYAILALAPLSVAQPRLEVASIRSSPPGLQATQYRGKGTDQLDIRHASVKQLISMAYGMPEFRIFGGPSWIQSDHYDIQAKASAPAGLEEMQKLVQSILVDRFKLSLRREEREMGTLELIVAKGGPKLDAPKPGGRNNARDGVITATNAPIEFIASMLTQQQGKTVVNKTGIEGRFSYELKWTPDGKGTGAEADTVSLFTAIQEQLGLKLEARKQPIAVIVVERVYRPTDN